jgi:hypothetical protein
LSRQTPPNRFDTTDPAGSAGLASGTTTRFETIFIIAMTYPSTVIIAALSVIKTPTAITAGPIATTNAAGFSGSTAPDDLMGIARIVTIIDMMGAFTVADNCLHPIANGSILAIIGMAAAVGTDPQTRSVIGADHGRHQ